MNYTNLDFSRIEKKSRKLVMDIAMQMLAKMDLPTDIRIQFTNSQSITKGESTRFISLKTGARKYRVQLPKQHGDNDSFMLFTLAHELVHVMQYHTGKLGLSVDRKHRNDTWWNGEFFSARRIRQIENEKGYFFTGWETEANNDGMKILYEIVDENDLTVTTSFLKYHAKHKKEFNYDNVALECILRFNEFFHRGLPKKAAA